MARYIDADDFYKSQVKRCGYNKPIIGNCTADNISLSQALDAQPTADVAPRAEIFAEIDKLFERLKKRECSNAVCTWCVHANAYGQRYEECDKPYIDKNGKEQKACYAYAKFESNIDNEFAELKKKYTEETP